jgi:hypothetical protein
VHVGPITWEVLPQDCSTDSMGKYCTVIQKLEDKFEGLKFHHVERDRNVGKRVTPKRGG